jgi:Uma2 family endonuclease
MTAEQLLELPDDGYRHELIRGELQTMAPAGGQHGQVAFAIGRLVGNHVHENKLGRCYAAETGFVLRRDPDTVRAPDLAFVASAGLSSEPSSGFLDEVPDLVVEVVSPSDRASEVTEKALAWLDYGVRLVWVIDPRARLVTVHRPGDVIGLVRGEKAVLDGADVLPGFRVTLDDLFA